MAVPHLAAPERLSRPRAAPPGRTLLAAGLLFAGACQGSPATLDEATYVEVMSRLTWARVEHLETAEGDSVRAAVLDELGVSGAELLEFAERHGDDVVRMDRIWEEIRLRVEELAGAPVPESIEGVRRRDPPDGG